MKNFTLYADAGTAVSTFVDLTLPAGTKTGKLFATNVAGTRIELTGAVTNVTDLGATITVPASYTLTANSPASLELQIAVGAGALTVYATGVLQVSAATGTQTVQLAGTPAVAQSGTWTFRPTTATSGGLSRRRILSAATTNATSVKATAGQVYVIHISNHAAAARFVKLYDMAAAPTVGTSVPVETYGVPAGQTFRVDFGNLGNPFAAGIGVAITGAAADTDTTVTAANDTIVQIHYA